MPLKTITMSANGTINGQQQKLIANNTISYSNVSFSQLKTIGDNEITASSATISIKYGAAAWTASVSNISTNNGTADISVSCSRVHGGSPVVDLITLSVTYNEPATESYLDNNIDAFFNFEPWQCGMPAVPEEFYKGSKNYQAYIDNGFCEPVQASNFKIGGKVIIGVKKGTAPKASKSLGISGNETISIYKANNTIYIKNKNTLIHAFDKNYWQGLGEADTPTCLGVVLVGAGGGGGGLSWFDANKNGKTSDHYIIPGTGGGGGGIVYGVINLKNTSNTNRFWITVGKGGDGGKNNSNSGVSNNNPKKGDDGKDGKDTILRNGNATSFGAKTYAIARGGKGGKKGDNLSEIAGGTGGDGIISNEYGVFYGCGKIQGSSGCPITTAEDKSICFVNSKTISISFLKDETDTKQFTYTKELSKLDATGNTNQDAVNNNEANALESVCVPGGHSFGMGQATVSDLADNGGGGCGGVVTKKITYIKQETYNSTTGNYDYTYYTEAEMRQKGWWNSSIYSSGYVASYAGNGGDGSWYIFY